MTNAEIEDAARALAARTSTSVDDLRALYRRMQTWRGRETKIDPGLVFQSMALTIELARYHNVSPSFFEGTVHRVLHGYP
jgi:hypothetical protein